MNNMKDSRRFKTSNSFNSGSFGHFVNNQVQFNPKQLSKDAVKEAHISAVEHLVSKIIILTLD